MHSIRIERPKNFSYAPVQFCGLELETDEGSEEYSMSLASSPTQPYLEFGARISESPWKRAFRALRAGDEVEIDGPYGHFILDEARDAVFVAGGIGITPLKGMMKYAADRHLSIRVHLLYSSRNRAEIAYRDEIDGIVRSNPNARLTHTLTRPEEQDAWTGPVGRIDASRLSEASEGLTEPLYYLCGKPDMVRDTAHMLRDDLGIARERIRAEQFWGYE